MLRRDIVIGGLLAVELVGMAGFSLWRKQRATATTVEKPVVLSVPASLVIGAKPEFLGKAHSPYTLIEFGDYQCPPCARIYPQTHTLVTRYDGKLKFVFRHYPLDMHTYALPAALAAEKARQKGKFWQMHDSLYKLQGKVDPATILAVTQQLNIDTKAGSDAIARATVERDRADGDKAGVEGTPTFILCCPDGKVVKLADLSQVAQFIK